MNNRQRKKLQAKMRFNLPNVPHFTAMERWDLFHTFSVYIAEGLKLFLAYEIFGVPGVIAEKYKEDNSDSEENFKPDKNFYEELTKEVEEMVARQNTLPIFDLRKEMSPEMKEWRLILSKMLWAFEQIRDDYPNSPFSKWHDKQFWSLLADGIMPMEIDEEPDECGLYSVKFNGEETPQEVWDEEGEYREKIQEGLNLFAEHFLSLWD